ALAAPNDPLYEPDQTTTTPVVGQWYLREPAGTVPASIDVETAWSNSTGNGVVIAMLDTGVRSSHPDLAGQLLSGYDFIADVATANDGNGRDADPGDPGDWITAAESASGTFKDCDESDSSWHGTQTAGLAAAATDNGVGMAGVARGAKLLPVRVLGKCGGFDSDIIDGMRWAAGFSVSGVTTNPNPARVINLSLGSAGTCSAAYQEVVAELTAAGVVVVAAAGNDGLAVGVPANCSGVIGVAGVRHAGTKVGYSSLGPQVTISAPAGNCVNETGECVYALLTTVDTGTRSPVAAGYTDGFNASVGTSFSSPLVAGTVALMLSANPDLTPAQVSTALRGSARAFPTTGADAGVAACQAPTSVAQDSECYCTTSTCGAGLLDAGAAVLAVTSLHASFTATPGSVTAGVAIALNAAGSGTASGRSIAGYLWEITDGASFAAFSGATDAATATLNTLAAGSVTVRLTITDNTGLQASSSQVVNVTAAPTGVTVGTTSGGGSGGGGGALTPLWALGLLFALAALWRRPRLRRAKLTAP
ncbi:MAG TPA: S8 family peptidase, partial [Ideonella sp.]|nr:S8 family peptidase [Ideonella sp.]